MRQAFAVVAFSLLAPAALAQDDDGFVHGSADGSVATARSANKGPIHALGSLGIANSDYFRGAYDGVGDDLDELTFPVAGAVVFDLPFERVGAFRKFSLTVGTSNSVASETPPGTPPGSNLRRWYEANQYVSLTAGLPNGWVAGATYTAYTSPSNLSSSTRELALAARYGGGALAGARPEIKVAVPTDNGDGLFLAVSAAPPLAMGNGRTLSFPLTLGFGLEDYYGARTRSTGFVSAGVSYLIPLGGAWSVSAGLDAIYRGDKLRNAGPAFADRDHLVFDAAVLLRFQY